MAELTAGERENISAMVRAEYMLIAKRIENDHLKILAQVNAALDHIQDSAQLVNEVRNEMNRVANLVDGFEIRLQDIEAEFGW